MPSAITPWLVSPCLLETNPLASSGLAWQSLHTINARQLLGPSAIKRINAVLVTLPRSLKLFARGGDQIPVAQAL